MTTPSTRVARRRQQALTLVLAVAALGLLAACPEGSWSPTAVAVLWAAVLLTDLLPVHLGGDDRKQHFTLTEGPLVAALVIGPGRGVVLGVAAGVLVAQLGRRLPRHEVYFGVARVGTASAVGTLLAQEVQGLSGALLGAAAFLAAGAAAGRARSRLTGRPVDGALRLSHVRLLHTVAVVSIGVLAAHTFLAHTALLPAFVAPALLVLWSQEQSTRRLARLSVVDALVAQAAAMYGRSSEETAALLTRTARQVMRAGRAELVLLSEQAPVVFTDGPDGVVRRTRLAHAELVEGWRGAVLETVVATARGTWAGVLVGRTEPQALLAVWRDEGHEAFRDQDVAVLQTLADTVQDRLSRQPRREGGALTLRRRVADLGDEGKELADGLAVLATVRQRLEASYDPHGRAAALAADLRDVEDRVAGFVGALVTDQRRTGGDAVVATGTWVGTA